MPSTQIQVTRDQLAEFLPNERLIKAFEQLMFVTGTTIPAEIVEVIRTLQEVSVEVGTTTANAELAIGLLSAIDDRLAVLTTAPVAIPDVTRSDLDLLLAPLAAVPDVTKNDLDLLLLSPAAGSQGEGTIFPGTTAQYWRGDKTWQDFATDVRAAVLTGLSTATNAVITAADTVLSALGKLQKQITDHVALTAAHGATGAVVGTTNSQTLTNKTLTTPVIAQISNTGTLTLPTSTDTLVGKATIDTLTNKTLTTPIISQISNTGTLTLPTTTDTLIGKATTDTLTNKNFDTAGTGNVFKINGTTITTNTGTGSNVLGTSPTITTPDIVGVTTASNANAGSVGEYLSNTSAALALTPNVALNTGAITLTPGDWDVQCNIIYTPAATTIMGSAWASLNTVSNTLNVNPGFSSSIQLTHAAQVGEYVTSPMQRFNVSTNTTVNAIALSFFTTSTCTAQGMIWARRRR